MVPPGRARALEGALVDFAGTSKDPRADDLARCATITESALAVFQTGTRIRDA
jgi:hypothetical protein